MELNKLNEYSYESILNTMLNRVPNTIDKREGSIIYDALAPTAYGLYLFIVELQDVVENQFYQFATGEALDYKAMEQGLERLQATYAYVKGEFKDRDGEYMDIPLGAIFSSITTYSDLKYIVEEKISTGIYKLKATQAGVIGSSYTGNIVPDFIIDSLGSSEITEVLEFSRDIETDEQLRDRIIQKFNKKSFGGNVTDYIEILKEHQEVGAVQVYPTWDGGGTVLVSVVTPDFQPMNSSKQQEIKEWLDPEPSGDGLGKVPIGHTVTVTTAEEVVCNIEIEYNITTGLSKSVVTTKIKSELGEYFKEKRKEWGEKQNKGEPYLIYNSTLISLVMSVEGVEAVTKLLVNGNTENKRFKQTKDHQQIPKLGSMQVS